MKIIKIIKNMAVCEEGKNTTRTINIKDIIKPKEGKYYRLSRGYWIESTDKDACG